MKTIIRLFVIIFLLLENVLAIGQNMQNDSIKCLKQISIYRELNKIGYTSEAYSRWQNTYQNNVTNKKRLLSDGEKYILAQLKQNKNLQIKTILLDSLLIVYSDWAIISSNNDFYTLKKALALYNYSEKDETTLLQIASLMKTAYLGLKNNFPSQAALAYFYTSKKLYTQYNYSAQNFYSDFIQLILFAKTNNFKQFQNKLYTEICQIEKNNWSEFTTQLIKLQDLNLQLTILLELTKKNIQTQPKNSIWPQQWIDIQTQNSTESTNKEELAEIYFLIANSYFAQNNLILAKQNAEKSLKTNPNNAMNYYLLGEIYINAAQSKSNETLNGVIFCLAADKFKKAAQLKPELKDSINKKIKWVQQYFPSEEDAFFKGISENSNYHFDSWINETTQIRFRENIKFSN